MCVHMNRRIQSTVFAAPNKLENFLNMHRACSREINRRVDGCPLTLNFIKILVEILYKFYTLFLRKLRFN